MMLPGSTKYTNPIIEVKPECLKCGYYMQKETNYYKCHVEGSCPAINCKTKFKK